MIVMVAGENYRDGMDIASAAIVAAINRSGSIHGGTWSKGGFGSMMGHGYLLGVVVADWEMTICPHFWVKMMCTVMQSKSS